MRSLFGEKLEEAVKAVAPLIALVCVLQLVFVRAPVTLFLEFLGGSLLAVLGMALLFAGIDLGVLPMGRFIGAELPEKRSSALIVVVAFALGFATTVAEPDVLVLATQVQEMSEGTISKSSLVYVMASGVGVFAAIALLRIVYGVSMRLLLLGAYGLVIAMSLLAPSEFVPLAYDAGSVTTGVLTAPVIIAVALGLSSVIAGRARVSEGFGLLGFASVGPIIAVLLQQMLER
jgi:hypothetical protein